MTLSRLSLTLALAAGLALTAADAQAQDKKPNTPETISANANVAGSAGAAATRIVMQVDSYTTDADRTAVEDALKHGGYPGFLTALRKAPVVGTVTVAGQTFSIRWARELPRHQRPRDHAHHRQAGVFRGRRQHDREAARGL